MLVHSRSNPLFSAHFSPSSNLSDDPTVGMAVATVSRVPTKEKNSDDLLSLQVDLDLDKEVSRDSQ